MRTDLREETIGGARRGRAGHQPPRRGGCTALARVVARRLPASEPGAGTWPRDRVPGADLPVLSRCSPGTLPVIWERELVGGASRSFLSYTWPPRLCDAAKGAGGARRGRRLSAPSDGWDATDGSDCRGLGVGSGVGNRVGGSRRVGCRARQWRGTAGGRRVVTRGKWRVGWVVGVGASDARRRTPSPPPPRPSEAATPSLYPKA